MYIFGDYHKCSSVLHPLTPSSDTIVNEDPLHSGLSRDEQKKPDGETSDQGWEEPVENLGSGQRRL